MFEDVGFAYDSEQVLRGVSFTAKEGEVTALVGPSGSGKSTCAKLAARLWDIDSGRISVGGVDISTVDPEVLLTDYSMVFQDVMLFDDTVMENIRLGKRGASDEEVLSAARAANCDEFVEKLPQGYATPIGENGAKLSGGERQRISIARAHHRFPLVQRAALKQQELHICACAALCSVQTGREYAAVVHDKKVTFFEVIAYIVEVVVGYLARCLVDLHQSRAVARLDGSLGDELLGKVVVKIRS